MISNKLFKLAKLIKCISELNTDQGVLISDVEFEVGVEVFVQDEETGDLIPAPAGKYETDTQIITVNEQGIIEAIEEKQSEPIENPEETPAEEEEKPAEEEEQKPVEQEEETPAEEQPAEEEEDKDAKIAELQGLLDAANAKIAELEALVADYQAKEKETPESIEEEDRKQHEQKYATMSRTERMLNALKNKK